MTPRKRVGLEKATYTLDLSNSDFSIPGGIKTPTFSHSPPMLLLLVTAHAGTILLGSTCSAR